MTKQRITLLKLTLGLGTILGMLNVTLFNVALPTMATVFDTTIATVQWLTSGYMLAAGMIILAAGFLGNHFGYKRIFCLSLICVLLLSILGAFAWCIEALIVVRFLFGLCAGLLPPLSLAMLYQLLPANRQTEAASTWGMANMIGGVLPSCLSGFILSVASWKFLLLFNVPFALLTLCLTVYFLPNDPPKDSAKLDCSGMFLTSAGSLILLISFSNLSKWGISLKLLIGLLLGFGCFIIYCVKSRNRSDVLLNLNVLKYRRYASALIASGINIVALYMIIFLMPLFLQSGLGNSPLVTGLIMTPPSLLTILAIPVAKNLFPKVGEKMLTIFGLVILLIGSAPFLVATPMTPLSFILIAMCIRCCGMGVVNFTTTNAQMSDIPPELSGHASALTNWLHQMLNAMVVSISSNIVDLRIAKLGAESTESIAWAYTTTTNLVMFISCLLLISIIPIALKFFRSKKEVRLQ